MSRFISATVSRDSRNQLRQISKEGTTMAVRDDKRAEILLQLLKI